MRFPHAVRLNHRVRLVLAILCLLLVGTHFALAIDPGSGPSATGAPHPLNDTGIDWCANADTHFLACPVAGYPGQDGEQGRDVTDNDPNDGDAGFHFTKLDAGGRTLDAAALDWTCVRDEVTGLIWEVKTADGGLRDRDWTYSWYDSDSPDGNPGTADGGACATGGRCDTEKFVENVNAQGLCGFTDWRMPTIKELAGIAHLGRTDPAINIRYFHNTLSEWFGSASPYADVSDDAWFIKFIDSVDGVGGKDYASRIRLVRSEQWFFSFVSHGDGTVTDENTGLMWAQCSAGQSGSDCSNGSAMGMTWQEALTYAENATLAGYDDWRLPNLKELRSLVDYSTYSPAIDNWYFPNTSSYSFWLASPSAGNSNNAWSIGFEYGYGSNYNKSYSLAVRLVRSGQCFGLLSFRAEGNGAGWVTSDPPGIDCGSDCNATYACGTAVTLTATPAAGSQLSGWSEASCGRASRCTFTLNGAQTVTAQFELAAPVTYSIQTSASPSNGGSVTCTPNPVEHGSNSTCTATPANGYRFSQWSGACSGTSPSCTLSNVTSAKSVTATFSAEEPGVTHAITTEVKPLGAGQISCQPNPVPAGDTSHCTATASTGYHFGYWSGHCSEALVNATCTLSQVNGARHITAHFVEPGNPFAVQSAQVDYYVPGALFSIDNLFHDPTGATLRELVWLPTLPPNWSIVEVEGDGAPQWSNNEIVFTGSLTSPIRFRYRISIAPEARNPQTLTAVVNYRVEGMVNAGTLFPERLGFTQYPSTFHSADYRDSRWEIDGTEFSRVLGYWRAGDYQINPEGVDGYADGSGRTDGPRHHADYQDPAWRIDSFEANRVAAYWRARAYHVELDSLDGYGPGAQQTVSTVERLSPLAETTPSASHSAATEHYTPGTTLTLTATLGAAGDAPLLALVWAPELPAGWSVTEVSGDGAPELSRTGAEILFTGQDLNLPLQFHYRVAVPANAQGTQRLGAGFAYQRMELIDPRHVTLEPLVLADTSGSCDNAVVTLTDPITSGQDSWRSEQGIEVAGTVAVGPGAALDLLAPRIEFAPGFRVEAGGRLQAAAAAVDCRR